MKKLSFYLIIIFLVTSCNSIKRVAEGEQLLTKNTVFVDDKKNPDPAINDYIIQRPNTKSLGLPLSLYFYNLGNPEGSKNTKEWAKTNPKTYSFFKNIFSEKQSIGVAKSFIGINNWFLRSGEAPVIIDDNKTKRTVENLRIYFQNEGYFKAKITAEKDTLSKKKGAINYHITKGNALFLDTISKNIKSPVLDSIYIENAVGGTVLEQNPAIDDLVKKNRTIYITVSKIVPTQVSMPDVVDMSLRLAIGKLKSYGLKIKTQQRPSECVNCVLKQEINGKTIAQNEKVKKEAIIYVYSCFDNSLFNCIYWFSPFKQC